MFMRDAELEAANSQPAAGRTDRSLLSTVKRLLRRGPAGRPRMIANFAVTYRCSSRCRTCNI